MNITKSKIEENVQLFAYEEIKNSSISERCVIGDRSRIINSNLSESVRIDRDNHVIESNIDRYTFTGRNTTIHATRIGSFCSISWNCSIGGRNHKINKISSHSFIDEKKYGFVEDDHELFDVKVDIGSDVWLGSGVTIIAGIKIGHGAIVGAGSVVTKDVEPYSIVAGNPAKKIRDRFSEEIKNILLKSKWWELPDYFIKENINIFNQNINEENYDVFINLFESFDINENKSRFN